MSRDSEIYPAQRVSSGGPDQRVLLVEIDPLLCSLPTWSVSLVTFFLAPSVSDHRRSLPASSGPVVSTLAPPTPSLSTYSADSSDHPRRVKASGESPLCSPRTFTPTQSRDVLGPLLVRADQSRRVGGPRDGGCRSGPPSRPTNESATATS